MKAGEIIIDNLIKDSSGREVNWETLYGLFENVILLFILYY